MLCNSEDRLNYCNKPAFFKFLLSPAFSFRISLAPLPSSLLRLSPFLLFHFFFSLPSISFVSFHFPFLFSFPFPFISPSSVPSFCLLIFLFPYYFQFMYLSTRPFRLFLSFFALFVFPFLSYYHPFSLFYFLSHCVSFPIPSLESLSAIHTTQNMKTPYNLALLF